MNRRASLARSFVRLLLVSVLTCVSAVAQAAPERGAAGEPTLVGRPAPDFALPAARGGRLQLSGQRGAPVVLVFFRGTW